MFHSPPISRAQGFTLVETIITVAVFALVSVGMALFIRNAYTTQSYTIQQARAINEARRGLKVMLEEIRGAQNGDDGSYALAKADDQEIIFYSSVDGDNDVERVHYYLDGSNLMRGVIEPQATGQMYPASLETTTIISQFMSNGTTPIFTYYNGDWPGDTINNPLPAPARFTDTKLIRGHLQINVDPTHAPVSFTLEGAAQLRNLKTNL